MKETYTLYKAFVDFLEGEPKIIVLKAEVYETKKMVIEVDGRPSRVLSYASRMSKASADLWLHRTREDALDALMRRLLHQAETYNRQLEVLKGQVELLKQYTEESSEQETIND